MVSTPITWTVRYTHGPALPDEKAQLAVQRALDAVANSAGYAELWALADACCCSDIDSDIDFGEGMREVLTGLLISAALSVHPVSGGWNDARFELVVARRGDHSNT